MNSWNPIKHPLRGSGIANKYVNKYNLVKIWSLPGEQANNPTDRMSTYRTYEKIPEVTSKRVSNLKAQKVRK